MQIDLLIVSMTESCFLRPPRNPFSCVNSLRGEILSDDSREGQLACGEIHVLHDAHQFWNVECFSWYVESTELVDVTGS